MLSLQIHQCVLSCCVKIQLCFDGEIRLLWKEERNEVITADGDRTLFPTFKKCQGKSHFITPANAACFGHHFESGDLNSRSIFSGKKSLFLIDHMVLMKIVRLKTGVFPWVATQQHWVTVTFFTDSQTKSMEIALEIAKLQACQCPEHLGDGHSLCLKTSFLTMPANQHLCQQCLLSKVTEDHHTNKLMKKGTEWIGSPAPCIDISSWSMPLTLRVFPSSPLWHLYRGRQRSTGLEGICWVTESSPHWLQQRLWSKGHFPCPPHTNVLSQAWDL